MRMQIGSSRFAVRRERSMFLFLEATTEQKMKISSLLLFEGEWPISDSWVRPLLQIGMFSNHDVIKNSRNVRICNLTFNKFCRRKSGADYEAEWPSRFAVRRERSMFLFLEATTEQKMKISSLLLFEGEWPSIRH
jgi:hypothetical protein